MQSDEHHPEDRVWDDLDELDAQNKDSVFQTSMAESEQDLSALNELLAQTIQFMDDIPIAFAEYETVQLF